MDSFYLGAYWGSRQESVEQCGHRLASCLGRLSEIDEAFESWFRRGVRKTAAKTPVELDVESLSGLLAQGVNRRDVGGDVIEELGYSVGLWNRARPAVGFSATVGAHPSFMGVLNSVVFDFPRPEAEALRLYEPRVAGAVIDAVVESWEPNWATWTTHAWRSAQKVASREPVVGWMTYLSTSSTVECAGITSRALLGGTVYAIGQSVNDVGERSVLELRGCLASTGALGPIS